MKKNGNGKSNGNGLTSIADSLLIQNADDDLDTPPVKPQEFHNVRTKSKEYAYYLICPWDRWWDEFSTKIDSKGRVVHKTVWAFAQAKGKSAFQQNVIYNCIGPRPQKLPNDRLKAPWLGDWQRRRSNMYAWSLSDATTIKSLQTVIKERKEAIEAARSLGPLAIKQISRIARLSEKIDKAFGGEPFLPDEPPDSAANRKRFATYISCHNQVNEMMKDATDQWLKAHGLNPSAPEQWLAALGAGVVGGAIGVLGAKVGLPQSDDQPTSTDLLLARALMDKAKTYQLVEPEKVIDAADIEHNSSSSKSNGKQVQ